MSTFALKFNKNKHNNSKWTTCRKILPYWFRALAGQSNIHVDKLSGTDNKISLNLW